MSAARLLAVADLIRTEIAAGPFTDPLLSPASVERVYDLTVDLDRVDSLKVYIIPLGWANVEMSSRGDRLMEYRLGFIVVDRYTSQGSPTTAWLDDRVRFVEANIWDRVGDVRTFDAISRAYPDTGEVAAYDIALLREQKVYWSEAQIAFREVG